MCVASGARVQLRLDVTRPTAVRHVQRNLGGVDVLSSEQLTKLLTCQLCQKTTGSLAEMHDHRLTHHGDYCNSLPATSSGVFDTQLLGLRHESCLCSVCGEIFSSSVVLKRHVAAEHSDTVAANPDDASATNDKRSKCSNRLKVCVKPWLHKCPVQRTGFHCKVCDRYFRSLNGLKAHECRRFLCKFCGRQFAQLAHLQAHTRTHTGERPYHCQTCGRGFSQLSSYRVHRRIHTGERPFLCSHCAKRFFTSTDLKEHIIVTHTDCKDFQCPVCGRKFALRKAMRRHVKVRHGFQFLHS